MHDLFTSHMDVNIMNIQPFYLANANTIQQIYGVADFMFYREVETEKESCLPELEIMLFVWKCKPREEFSAWFMTGK